MPLPNRCEVCGEPTGEPVEMCPDCERSYHNARDVGDVFEAILWAARRARWYAERKSGRLARARKTTRAR
jgi:hypothetical protein